MSREHRSIGQRLERAKSSEAKLATINEWHRSWERDMGSNFRLLERALSAKDFELATVATGRLKGLLRKKLQSLPRVAKRLLGDVEGA